MIRTPLIANRMAPIPVNQICDELWGCQEGEQAVPWLQLLNHSILRVKLETYDVAECFLSVQGTAFRFSAPVKPGEEPPEGRGEYDDEILSRLWEESIWAAAAMARICVGPAWVFQLQQSRTFLSNNHLGPSVDDATWTTGTSNNSLQNDTTPLEVVSTNNSSPRSSSPMTFASAVESDVHFPPIPEALPGAMLRFGASALEFLPRHLTTRCLAEGQRELVLALCCYNSGELEGPERLEWTIPGAHEPVEIMMRFWLESTIFGRWGPNNPLAVLPMKSQIISTEIELGWNAQGQEDHTAALKSPTATGLEAMVTGDNAELDTVLLMMDQLKGRTLDWWYCLQVARASMDLISSGWRPQRGHDVVIHLLDMAEKGVSLVGLTCDSTDTGKKGREERLAATASAAEAISALSSMGSRGVIPESVQAQVVHVLVTIQVVASQSDKIVAILYPVEESGLTEDEGERQLERETFLSQRDACFTDTLDLLWVLLAEHESAVISFATLVEILNGNSNARAAVAVRVLSGALWGKPPSVPSIDQLRIYWRELLDMLARKSHSNSLEIQQGKSLLEIGTVDMFALALEIVAALGRFVDATLLRGTGDLTPAEWNSFIQAFDVSIVTWLSFDHRMFKISAEVGSISSQIQKQTMLLSKIQQEIENMLLKVGDFLDRAATSEARPYHFIVDDKCRSDLHLMLMRKAIPRMSETKATMIGCSVIRSWASVDFLPYRRDEWVASASNMVKEAFTVVTDVNSSVHLGYMHSPLVRLEVLKLVTFNDDYQGSWCMYSVDEESTSNSNSSLFISPFRATRFLREHHLELINEVLIPALNRIFGFEKGGTLFPNVVSTQETWQRTVGYTNRDQSIRLDNAEFSLRKYSVQLIGILFRNEAGEKEHRKLCIEMLRAIASWPRDEIERAELEEVRGSNISEGNLFSKPVIIAVEAIRQLELCLSATFHRLPYSHNSAVLIVEAFRMLLEEASAAMQQSCNRTDVQTQLSYVLLAFGTILPLARLRTTFDKRIFLADREDVLWHVPGSLSPFLVDQNKEWADLKYYGNIAASFVAEEEDLVVDHAITHGLRAVTKWSLLSFSPIVSSLLISLQAFFDVACLLGENTASLRFLNDLQERLIATCLDALGNFIISGANLQNLLNITSVLSSMPKPKGTYRKEVEVSTCKTSTVVAQQTIAMVYNDTSQQLLKAQSKEATVKSINGLVDVILETCSSDDIEITIAGCRNLRALLVSGSCSHGLFRSGNPSIVLRILCQRLTVATYDTAKPSSDQSDGSTEYWMHGGDVILALLSAIYDVVHQFKVFGDRVVANAERDLMRDVMTLCFNVVQLPDQTKARRTSAMRCALIASNMHFLCTFDSQVAISMETLGEVSTFLTTDDTGNTHEQKIWIELLQRRQQELYYSQGKIVLLNAVEIHERAAQETENIKRFVVEVCEGSEICAAWLCGHCLLIIRLGAKHSRYCGWVEVTLHSLSFRKRTLVRISNSVSLDWPELPSSLWVDTTSDDAMTLQLSATDISPNPIQLPVKSDALSRALQLLSRADAELYRNIDVQIHQGVDIVGCPILPHPTSPGRHSCGTRSPMTSPPANSVMRKTDEEKIPAKTLRNSESFISIETANSIHSWLCEVFSPAGDEKVECVEDFLEQIGLSKQDLISNTTLPNHERSKYGMHPIVRLRMDAKAKRAISILDRTTTINAHKVALLYAGRPMTCKTEEPDQASFEAFLLGTSIASTAFHEFSYQLGRLVKTSHLTYFSGGFDTSGLDTDGKYALVWLDSLTLVLFHTVLFMPGGLNARKRHVGNDNVHILFVEPSCSLYQELSSNGSEIETSSTLVSGQFGFLTIFVLPMHHMYRIIVQLRPGLDKKMRSQLIHFCGEDLVPKTEAAAEYVRHMAVCADLACRSVMEDLLGPPTVWEDRFSQLNNMERYTM